VGKVYPSNATFKQCAAFLWSGKAYAFQRLEGEETVTSARSLILSLRRWHPSTWQLGPAEEYVAHEDTPLVEFKEKLAAKWNIKQVSIAKNSWSSTDPLEIVELDWSRERDADDRSTLSSRPFYFHDTDVIVVRDLEEPLKELSADEKKAMKRRANVASNKYSGREKALHISTGQA